MIKIAEELYAKLQEITPNVFFHILPANPDEKSTLLVYELNDADSLNTMGQKNYANQVDLTVKILNPDALVLLQLGEQVKALLLGYSFTQCRDLNYRNSVPIFPDEELKTNQYTLLFGLYADGTGTPATIYTDLEAGYEITT